MNGRPEHPRPQPGVGRQPPPRKPASLLRSIGQFFGHVVEGARSDPSRDGRAAKAAAPMSPPPGADTSAPASPATPAPVAVRARVEERAHDTPDGRVILRRTVIDEVIRDDTAQDRSPDDKQRPRG